MGDNVTTVLLKRVEVCFGHDSAFIQSAVVCQSGVTLAQDNPVTMLHIVFVEGDKAGIQHCQYLNRGEAASKVGAILACQISSAYDIHPNLLGKLLQLIC